MEGFFKETSQYYIFKDALYVVEIVYQPILASSLTSLSALEAVAASFHKD